MERKDRKRMKYLSSIDEIPDFKNEEEEAEFWATHSLAKIWDKLEDIGSVELDPELKKKIRERYGEKRLLTIRLDQEQIEAAKEIAERKSIGYQTLMRMWITEGINREKIKEV